MIFILVLVLFIQKYIHCDVLERNLKNNSRSLSSINKRIEIPTISA